MSFLFNILEYFFKPLPTGIFKYTYLFLALAIISLLASIALRLYLKQQKDDKIFKKLFKDLPGKIQLFAIAEALYVAARYTRMPYLSIRFLHYMILAYGIYTAIRYGQLYLKIYPTEKKRHLEQLKMNQYVPRKGGKKR